MKQDGILIVSNCSAKKYLGLKVHIIFGYLNKQSRKLGSPGEDFLNLLLGRYTSNVRFNSLICISCNKLEISKHLVLFSDGELELQQIISFFNVQGMPYR